MTIIGEFTDSEIVELLRNRNTLVVRYLTDRYGPMIRLMVHHSGGTIEDAHDILQEALIKILEKIDNNDFVLSCKFKTFLFSIAKNLWLSKIEQRKKEQTPKDVDSISDEEIEVRINETLLFYYKDLNQKQKLALYLHYKGKSDVEIAHILGWKNKETARKNIKLAQDIILSTKKSIQQKKVISF